ncbi:MAG: 50S ribosomal protein L3 [Bdellovibrionota bacterium]
MKVGILGRKVGMTRVYDDNGALVPVTVVDTSDCVITQVKLNEKDGYAAIQVGLGAKKPQNVNKAQQGHFKKAGTPAKAAMQEIRVASDEAIAHLKPGQALKLDMFQKGDKVDVVGTSKGHGFTGVMKRHNFSGAKSSHGVHEFFRHGGSMGANTWPGRIVKKKKMPGHWGDERKTVQNLEIVEVKADENLLLLKGAVPGSRKGLVFVQSAKKRPAPTDRQWV